MKILFLGDFHGAERCCTGSWGKQTLMDLSSSGSVVSPGLTFQLKCTHWCNNGNNIYGVSQLIHRREVISGTIIMIKHISQKITGPRGETIDDVL